MKTFSSRFLRHIIASGALIILSSSLLACSSDPTAPTDENFAAAILAAQKAEALCLDQNPLQDSRGGFSDKAVLVQSPSRWAA